MCIMKNGCICITGHVLLYYVTVIFPGVKWLDGLKNFTEEVRVLERLQYEINAWDTNTYTL